MLTNNQHISQIYIEIQKEIGQVPFDYNYLLSKLHGYHFPRNKIGIMIRNGEIQKVKKGLYTLSPEYNGPVNRFLLANLIFGPSYVSLESALAYWGLIPEQVNMVTSVTTKRNKNYNTPAGVFSYRHTSPAAYPMGITRVPNDTDRSSFLIATPEKALCDKVSIARLTTIKGAGEYVEENLRIERTDLAHMDPALLRGISEICPGRSVTLLYKWYGKTFKEG